MIDEILLNANIEVEEFCLSRELTNLEKANIALAQIPAEYKQIIPLKNLPENSQLKLHYMIYKGLIKVPEEDYSLVRFGEFAVLFIYKLTAERAYLFSSSNWMVGFDLPNKYMKENKVVSRNK